MAAAQSLPGIIIYNLDKAELYTMMAQCIEKVIETSETAEIELLTNEKMTLSKDRAEHWNITATTLLLEFEKYSSDNPRIAVLRRIAGTADTEHSMTL